jgi:hypothetical protein
MAKKQPIKLTLKRAEELYNGLMELSDGSQTIVSEGGRDRVVSVKPKWSMPTMIAIARNLNELKPVIAAHHDAVVKRTRDLAMEDGRIPMSDQILLQSEMEAVRNAVETYQLTKLTVKELKLESSGISPVVVSKLDALLIYDDEDANVDPADLREAAE